MRQETALTSGGMVLVGDIPREPVAFRNRTALLSCLHDPGEDERVTVVSAVTGVRGVGKTQLAGAYARQCIAEHWALVAWITAEDAASLRAGLAELAEQAGVRSPGQDTELAALAARDFLERTTAPSLVVFDNATDPDELARWLPRAGRSRIVITSTLRTFVALGTTVDVDVFSPDEAVAYLPLALSQAAWLITNQGLTAAEAAEYVDRLRMVPVRQMLGRVPGEPYPTGMARAALLSLAEAESVAPEAPLGELANLISVLSPSGVGRDVLIRAVCARTPTTSAHDVDAALGIEVLADIRRLLPGDEERTLRAMTRQGTAYGTSWDHEHAVPLLRESVNGFTRILGAMCPTRWSCSGVCMWPKRFLRPGSTEKRSAHTRRRWRTWPSGYGRITQRRLMRVSSLLELT